MRMPRDHRSPPATGGGPLRRRGEAAVQLVQNVHEEVLIAEDGVQEVAGEEFAPKDVQRQRVSGGSLASVHWPAPWHP